MTESATIIFSQTGVQPPVYVVTSLSEPPWVTLEMHVDKAQTASANLIFTRHFDNVTEGDHQYKIRIGHGHWVVDESKDTATDEHGNRNNVLHVKAAKQIENQNTANNDSSQPEKSSSPPQESRKDSTMDASDMMQLPSAPVPFVVVEKAADKEPAMLPEKPRVVVEKTDDSPAYGDDFGANATVSQRVAHDMRAADAEPNMLVITPEGQTEPSAEEDEAAPLFRHESFQSPESPSTPTLETIDEVSTQSSTDHIKSEDITDTPSDANDSQYGDLNHGPLLSHEAGIEGKDFDELNNGPLLSHETGMNGDICSSDEDMDELDAAPLLPHETGFSQYKGSEVATNSDNLEDDVSKPRHYMYGDDDEDDEARGFEPDEASTFTHEDDGNCDDDAYQEDDTPLLAHERSHERDFAIADNSSPEEGGGFTLKSQSTFGYEDAGDSARALFGGRGRPGIFRARSNSSTLPHKLPKTDEEDENLADPSLERFPTRREQILERVATIGLHLPEDESMEDHVHSPVMSVLSQACSSVDLVPVKSYISLASVPEADDSDEEAEADGDVDSLPSPMVMNFDSASIAFTRDPHATPMPDDNKQLGHTEKYTSHASTNHTKQVSEADSVAEIDGAKESVLGKLHETIASPAKILNPITPPLTPENEAKSICNENATQLSEPQLRQRQMLKEDKSASTTPEGQDQEASSDHAVTSSNKQQLVHHNETFLQTFFRVVFGSVGRFFTACVGDRKRAGITMFAVSIAATAYYVFALA